MTTVTEMHDELQRIKTCLENIDNCIESETEYETLAEHQNYIASVVDNLQALCDQVIHIADRLDKVSSRHEQLYQRFNRLLSELDGSE